MSLAPCRAPTCLLGLLAATLSSLALAGCSGTSVGDDPQVFRLDVADGDVQRLSDDERGVTSPAWSPGGTELAYIADGRIVVVDANGDHRRAIFSDRQYAARGLDWSPGGGSIAVAAVADETEVKVGFVTVDGKVTRWLDLFRNDRSVDALVWSPDGTRLAYVRPLGQFRLTSPTTTRPLAPQVDARPLRVFVVSPSGGGPHVVPTGATAFDPQWSPDGRSLLLKRDTELVVRPTTSTGTTRVVLHAPLIATSAAWSPSGRHIAFTAAEPSGERRTRLYLVATRGGRPSRVVPTEIATRRPAWSPDGGWIAFADYGGRIVTVRLRDGSTKEVADLDGAAIDELAWSPSGRSIAFVANKRRPED